MSRTVEALLVRGAQLAEEGSRELRPVDVLVERGRISAVAPDLSPPDGVEVVEAGGRVLLPGMFAAVNGGVTGLVSMPDTSPPIDSAGLVRSVLDIAARDAEIPVLTTGCITKDRAGVGMAPIHSMREAGAVMVTEGGAPVSNPAVLRRAMEYAREFDLPLGTHPETPELSGEGAINEGRASYRLGLPGIPAISEEICISRDIQLARYTGAHLHIQQLSTARGVEIVRRAKEDGVRVTCEVAPHHLLFHEGDLVEYDTHLKVNPPLRTAGDSASLLAGLTEGVIDVIATGHAPHTAFEKGQLDFASAPFGITGLETALPSLYHHFVREGKLDWGQLVCRFSAEPRRVVKQEPVEVAEGAPAEFVLFDPEARTTFDRGFMRSKASNTPFLDQTLDGRVDLVVLGGRVLLERG